MSDRPDPDPDDDLEVPEHSTPETNEITTGRRMLWVVGGGVGLYLLGSGIWGLINKDEDGQPEEKP